MSIFKKLFGSYLISSALLSSQTHKYLSTTKPHTSQMSSTEFSIAYVTAPNADVAKDIANKLVTTQLAACVNIIPSIVSIYRWKDKIETDSEVLMMIKTRTTLVDELTALVKSNHPYDVCEVISVPIQNGNQDYLKWLAEVVPNK